MKDLDYIDKYYFPSAVIFTVLFIIFIPASAYLTFCKCKCFGCFSSGGIILLLGDAVIALLCVISWLAMFRELGRYKARQFDKEKNNKVK